RSVSNTIGAETAQRSSLEARFQTPYAIRSLNDCPQPPLYAPSSPVGDWMQIPCPETPSVNRTLFKINMNNSPFSQSDTDNDTEIDSPSKEEMKCGSTMFGNKRFSRAGCGG